MMKRSISVLILCLLASAVALMAQATPRARRLPHGRCVRRPAALFRAL